MALDVMEIAKDELNQINADRLEKFRRTVRSHIDNLGYIALEIKSLEKQIEAKKLQAVKVKEEMKALTHEDIDASILE